VIEGYTDNLPIEEPLARLVELLIGSVQIHQLLVLLGFLAVLSLRNATL
jgi:hypothetical protein